MRCRLASAVAVVIFLLTGLDLIAKEKGWGPFDRLAVTQNFIDALYPELKHTQGLIALRTEEFHASTGADEEIDILPCHPGSGVAGGGQPQFVHCRELYPTGPSGYLNIRVKFSDRYPIRTVEVHGSFLNPKNKDVEKEIVEHPQWNDQQRMDALRRADPKFGPERKTEFLRTVPIREIGRFLGCQLKPETAVLIVARGEDSPPDPTVAFVHWRISGRPLDSKRSHAHLSCVARFEPFDGNLIQAGDF